MLLPNMINAFRALKSQFSLTHSEKRFIEFARKKWEARNDEGSRELLMEMQRHAPYLFRSAYQSNYLAKTFNLKIKTINPLIGTASIFLHKFFYPFTAVSKLYAASGVKPGLNFYSCSLNEKWKSKKLAKDTLKKLSSKEDILQIKIGGISVGDLIYDSYLRRYGLPTIDLKDSRLYLTIYYAYLIFFSAEKYFKKHKTKLLVMSHAVYIQHGIVCRLALEYDIKVYLFPAVGGKIIHKLSKKHYLQTANHARYQERFLEVEDKKQALNQARSELNNRLNGGIDSGTAYMRSTAYSDEKDSQGSIAVTKKPVVIVFLHCFFDSPHIYKHALFPDFYEWLSFTLKILNNEDYDVYVKPHPNGLPGNEAIIIEFEKKYLNVKFLDKSISNRYIASLGVAAVVTVYGTVGHEFPYQGIPVIAAGDNPHVSYSFCNTAKSIKEYEFLLKNVKSLPNNFNKEEIEQFFYMHYLSPGNGRITVQDDWYKFIKKIKRAPNEPELLDQLIDSAEHGDFDNIERYFKLALNDVDNF